MRLTSYMLLVDAWHASDSATLGVREHRTFRDAGTFRVIAFALSSAGKSVSSKRSCRFHSGSHALMY